MGASSSPRTAGGRSSETSHSAGSRPGKPIAGHAVSTMAMSSRDWMSVVHLYGSLCIRTNLTMNRLPIPLRRGQRLRRRGASIASVCCARKVGGGSLRIAELDAAAFTFQFGSGPTPGLSRRHRRARGDRKASTRLLSAEISSPFCSSSFADHDKRSSGAWMISWRFEESLLIERDLGDEVRWGAIGARLASAVPEASIGVTAHDLDDTAAALLSRILPTSRRFPSGSAAYLITEP